MSDLTEKWGPVLQRCKNLKEEDKESFVLLLDNQLIAWMVLLPKKNHGDKLKQFTFIVPVLAKLYEETRKRNIKIDPISIGDSKSGVDWLDEEVLIENVSIPSVEYLQMEYDSPESIAALFSRSICDHLEEKHPGKIFQPYLVLIPNSPVLDSLEPGINMAFKVR